MKISAVVALLCVASGVASAAEPEAAPAAASSPAATPTTPPPNPKAIPVPDMPVVKKTELEGGLIAEDLKIGEGYEVQAGGSVVAHYHGTLKEGGKVFDSSFERGEPIAFPLDGVIEGWQKGVPGMKVGGIRRLTIPSKMGYGEQGAGANIPPNSDLVFVIQLVDALRYEDVKIGDGETAELSNVSVTTYTIKGADGTVIEKADAAKPYIWIPGEYLPMASGITGMKVGGKRTITVPKEFNQANPQAPKTARPSDVPITIEVELLNVRNLGGGRGGRR